MLLRTLNALMLTFLSVQARNGPLPNDPHTQTVSISVNTSILPAAIKFGTDTHTPIGIVLDTDKPETLCEEYRHFAVQDTPVPEFLNHLLAGSDYFWAFEGQVVVIRPTHLSDQTRRVLDMTFDRFGGMRTTMQGLGTTLHGWIYSKLNPGSGFAGEILSSLDSEHFAQFNMQNASVEQILNAIVSLGSKGIWVIQLPKDFERKKDVDLHTYSYKDDAHSIQAICESIRH